MSSDVRNRIIENTTDLFLRRGIKSVTMDEIAIENGISKRTLYELFDDKSDLLEACIIHKDKCSGDIFHEFENSSDNILELFINMYKKRSEIMMKTGGNFFDEIKRYYPEIYKRTLTTLKHKRIEHSREMLELGQKQGVFIKGINTELVSNLLSEMIMMLNNSEIMTGYRFDKIELFRDTIIIYARGISTEKGRAIIDEFIDIEN